MIGSPEKLFLTILLYMIYFGESFLTILFRIPALNSISHCLPEFSETFW